MREKRIIATLLILVLLVVIVVVIYLLVNKARKSPHELADFAFVEVGMSFDEIVDRLGEPDRDQAFGIYAPEYDLVDGHTVMLRFSPAMRLIRAWIITPQGEQVDLFEYRDQQRQY